MAHAYTQIRKETAIRKDRWSAPREYVQAGSRTIASAASAWWLARWTIKYECGTFHARSALRAIR
jgi:hypothetical protein